VKYSVLTFGCRVNQAESLAIERELAARGAVPAPAAEADLVLVNSCSVTATADQGTRQAIRRVARDNPAARIVVTGCYATRQPDELRELAGVVRVVPNARKDTIVADLTDTELTTAERYAGEQGPCGARVGGTAPSQTRAGLVGSPLQLFAPGMGGRTAFTLRVQTGCEEGCTYCIIPSTRGGARSTPVEAVVAELRRVEEAGYREVTLTGVHLGAYGRDLSPASTLTTLIERAVAATRGLLFRLGSLEPMDCPTALVDLAEASGRLAPSFHLPLQHASNRMLTAMGRPYTIESYAALVEAIRERLPYASIGTDVIVGFPGEGDGDAARLVGYLESSPLTHLHVFPYSDRPGTPASRMQPKVHGTAIRERAAAVRAVGRELSARFERSLAGSIRPGLTIDDGATVLTDNGLKVRIMPAFGRNVRVRVRVEQEVAGLRGEVVKAEDREDSRWTFDRSARAL
jgi:threonylcarbamoyladenosine tRNA methylthiotransferase MtaB